MELSQLKYFVTIAETLSYTRAAELEHISQPALSYQMKRLEEELAVKLFRRQGRSIALTSEGELFMPMAQTILARANEAVRIVRDHSGVEAGEVTVGVVPSVAIYLLPDILASFHQVYPRVKVDLVEGGDQQLQQMVFAGTTDFAVVGSTDSPHSLERVSLGSETLMAVTSPSHRLADQMAIDITQLRNETFALPAPTYYFASRVIEICRRAGFEPKVNYHTGSTETLKGLVRVGLAVSVMPAMAVAGIGREGMAVLRLRGNLKRELYLVRSKDRDMTQAAQVLMTHVRSSVTNHMTHPPEGVR